MTIDNTAPSGSTDQLAKLKHRVADLEQKLSVTQKALHQSRKELQYAFKDPAIGMMRISAEGRILAANAYVCGMLGYTEDELMQKTYRDITHPDDLKASVLSERRILNRELRFDHLEKRYIKKNGEAAWILLSYSMLFDRDQQPLYYVTHLQDITDRKKIEKELEKHAESLNEVNTALKVLLDHREQEKVQLEHNIYTNLKKLVSPYLEKLQSKPLDGAQKAFLEIALSNLDDITAPLTTKLLTWESKLTPTELDIAVLIRHGKTTDAISELLNISSTTVAFHRRNIRSKLGLKNKKINLITHLRTIS